MFGMMIDIGPNFYAVIIINPLSFITLFHHYFHIISQPSEKHEKKQQQQINEIRGLSQIFFKFLNNSGVCARNLMQIAQSLNIHSSNNCDNTIGIP